jgi:hypothetical protein
MPADAGLPDFLRVEPNGAEIRAVAPVDQRATALWIGESVEGGTLPCGIEKAKAWSAALSADRSRLTGVVAGEGGAFLPFGSCTNDGAFPATNQTSLVTRLSAPLAGLGFLTRDQRLERSTPDTLSAVPVAPERRALAARLRDSG